MPLRREAGTTPEKEGKVPEATVRKRPWHRCPSSPGAERPRDGSRGHGQADHAGRVHRGQTSVFTLRARERLKRFWGGGDSSRRRGVYVGPPAPPAAYTVT